MQEEHRKKIRRNWVRLSQETPIPEILTFFYQEGLASRSGVEDVLWEKPTQRSWAFLDVILRSGPKGFDKFVQALEIYKKQELATLLRDG